MTILRSTALGAVLLSCTALFQATTAQTTAQMTLPARAAVSTVTVSASLPSTAPQFVNDTAFTSAILNSTNTFRRQHNASAAVWNATIADFAADYLASDTNCTFAHSGGPYGENLAIGCSDVTPCVDMWGNERRSYDFADPGFTEDTGHFSQLVWKDSTTVGCGRHLCTAGNGSENTGWFLVCEYWPRGNIIGEFAQEMSRQVSGDGDGDYVTTSRPSSGVITGALVVFALIVSAWVGDIVTVVGDD